MCKYLSLSQLKKNAMQILMITIAAYQSNGQGIYSELYKFVGNPPSLDDIYQKYAHDEKLEVMAISILPASMSSNIDEVMFF